MQISQTIRFMAGLMEMGFQIGFWIVLARDFFQNLVKRHLKLISGYPETSFRYVFK